MNGLSVDVAGGVGVRRAPGFWRRQFGATPTHRQRRFDLMFGFVIPVLCFVFDPLIFRSWIMGEGILQRFQFYAYSVSAVEMVALGVWLFQPRGVGRRQNALAGILLAGGAFSLVVGLVISPLSVLGLCYIVGALGFVPVLTAIVYLRNGLRAVNLGRAGDAVRLGDVGALLFGFAFALGVPAASYVLSARAVAAAAADVRAGRELSPERLRALRMASAVSGVRSCDTVVWDYRMEKDPARRAQLAKVYEAMTGEEIEHRLAVLSD